MHRWIGVCAAVLVINLWQPAHAAMSGEDAAVLQSLIDSRQYRAALERVDTELEKEPMDEALLLSRGYLLVALNRLDAAAAHYLRTLELLPNRPEPGNNLAIVYRNQGRYADALVQLDNVIRAHPLFDQAYSNLTQVCRKVTRRRGEFGLWFSRERGEIEAATEFCDNYDHTEVIQAREAASAAGSTPAPRGNDVIQITTLRPTELPSAPLPGGESAAGLTQEDLLVELELARASGQLAESRAAAAEEEVAGLKAALAAAEARMAELVNGSGGCD